MNALITYASRYAGLHAAKAIVGAGYRVYCHDQNWQILLLLNFF